MLSIFYCVKKSEVFNNLRLSLFLDDVIVLNNLKVTLENDLN